MVDLDSGLRALRDCGVIRARWYQEPCLTLLHKGYASADSGGNIRNYRLTGSGQILAARLPPKGCR